MMSCRLVDLSWEGVFDLSPGPRFQLPYMGEAVHRRNVVCDAYHLWKLVRNRLADRQLRHHVALCPVWLGGNSSVHLHTLVGDLDLPHWLLEPSRTMDDLPPVILAERGSCHAACEAGHPHLLLALAPLTVDLLSLRLPDQVHSREQRLNMITFVFCFVLSPTFSRRPGLRGAGRILQALMTRARLSTWGAT
jgi:hypothetical protein